MRNSWLLLSFWCVSSIFSCWNRAGLADASPSSPLQKSNSTSDANIDSTDNRTCVGSSSESEGEDENDTSCAWKDDGANSTATRTTGSTHSDYCTLVVAPSTIPNAGLGIFTLVDLCPDQQVGDFDLVIPMKEIMMLRGIRTTIFDDYTWSGRIYQGPHTAYAPGLQSMANSHLGMFNIFPQPARKIPSANLMLLHDAEDDDDSTAYHHMTTLVGDRHIPAGGELFAMYGDHWFEGRVEKFGSIDRNNGNNNDDDTDGGSVGMALSDDYDLAENLANSFQRRFGDSDSTTTTSTSTTNPPDAVVKEWSLDLWELIVDIVRLNNGPPAARILPAYTELLQTQQFGIRSLYQHDVTRSVQELKQMITTTGRCIDTIQPGPSEIHQYGAFAKRPYPKGGVITGSPLLHSQVSLWNTKLQVWNATTKSYQTADNSEDTIATMEATSFLDPAYALLINYCWSHVQSSILICPYAPGVPYINHASQSTETTAKEDFSPLPNIEIRWAPHGQLSQNDDAFQLTPTELADNNHSGKVTLALDYVALRDIAPGEELLVDYGKAWENARNDFERQKKGGNGDPTEDNVEMAVREYNEGQYLLRTEAEQVKTPYPEGMELKCHPMVMTTNTLPTEGDDEALLWRHHYDAGALLECSVLERQKVVASNGAKMSVYAVRVFHEGTWRGRGGIPRRYIRWFASKAAATNIFRFPMQLPDSMVPDSWRDL